MGSIASLAVPYTGDSQETHGTTHCLTEQRRKEHVEHVSKSNMRKCGVLCAVREFLSHQTAAAPVQHGVCVCVCVVRQRNPSEKRK